MDYETEIRNLETLRCLAALERNWKEERRLSAEIRDLIDQQAARDYQAFILIQQLWPGALIDSRKV
jgi:hypothetical protein